MQTKTTLMGLDALRAQAQSTEPIVLVPAELGALLGELDRLTLCLVQANDQTEDYERRYYLTLDKQEAAETEVARLKLALAEADRRERHARCVACGSPFGQVAENAFQAMQAEIFSMREELAVLRKEREDARNQKPIGWGRNFNNPHPTMHSDLRYMSSTESADAYQPLYLAAGARVA